MAPLSGPEATQPASRAIPWPAKLLSVTAFTVGFAVFVTAVWRANDDRHSLDWHTWVVVTVIGLALVTTWTKPLIMFRGEQSTAIHVDEAFFVILACTVPPAVAVLTFAIASVFAQIFRRRPIVKSMFNFGQLTACVAAAVEVSRTLAPAGSTPGLAELGAVVVGVAVLVTINSGAVAAVLAATGLPWREALLEGWSTRLRVIGSGLAVGVLATFAISVHWWSIFATIVLLVALRQVLSGHFRAQHDRIRLRGLFEATLDANQSMLDEDVVKTLSDAARRLLRCSAASIEARPPLPGELGAGIQLGGESRWLIVSGRSRAEPFDEADTELLEALAAIGSGALTNATLYRQVRHERGVASEEHQRLSAITSSIADGVVALDALGDLIFVNAAAAHMLGWEVVAQAPGARRRAPEFLAGPGRRVIETGEVLRRDEAVFERTDGRTFPVAFTAAPVPGTASLVDRPAPAPAIGAVIAFQDMTERMTFERELTHQAFYDSLTGLPNRRLFLAHLEQALRRPSRGQAILAVLFADVDRFKLVNDSFGHQSGDQVLAVIADRMRSAARASDLLSRFGGDEFTLLLEDTDIDKAVSVSHRLHDALREPITLADGAEIIVTLSIGVAVSGNGRTGEDVVRDADVAMYRAKARGRGGRTQIFDSDAMASRSAERLRLESELRRALDRNELEVFYQPYFALDGAGRVVGAEALVRWNHPTRGLVEPGQFIGLAEDTGLILPLGRRVLQNACREVREIEDRLGLDLTMSVNLSPREFQQPGLVDGIAETLQASGLRAQQLCLEITETVVMDDIQQSAVALASLKNLGVKLAIDDFGTGYSSLGYLKYFPIDIVKIDRSFVVDLGSDTVDFAIVAAVVGLAKAIGIATVAEGVENAEQVSILQSLGCTTAQGYYFSRPLAGAAFNTLLDRSVGQA